jgi:WD40 repeat protein
MNKNRTQSGFLFLLAGLWACSCVVMSGNSPSNTTAAATLASTAKARPTETMAQSATPSGSGIRDSTPLLLMSRLAEGGMRYSIYGEMGVLLRELNSPPSSAGLEPMMDGDISPDGKYLAAVTGSSPCKYAETHGACSSVLFLYVFDLSTGAIRFTIPLLESPEDLLAEIRQLVIIPYDEKRYPSAEDPRAAYEAEMEKWIGDSWDFYIAALGSHAWSADGTQLAFSTQNAKADTAVRVLNIREESEETLTAKPMSTTTLEWSPDGAWVLAEEYAAGQFESEGWYIHSRQGNATIKVADAGDYVRWIDSHRIAHVLYDFDQKMALFDIQSEKDAMFFESPMAQYAIAKDRSFAAIAENLESEEANIWYCPFDGSQRIWLDRIKTGQEYYVKDVIPIPPNLVFLGLEQLADGQPNAMTVWMYSPGAEKTVLREDVRSYAVSHDGTYAAFYSMEGELIIQLLDGGFQKHAIEVPKRMLWHPWAEVLLAQTATEVMVFDAESGHRSVIPIPQDTTLNIAMWI